MNNLPTLELPQETKFEYPFTTNPYEAFTEQLQRNPWQTLSSAAIWATQGAKARKEDYADRVQRCEAWIRVHKRDYWEDLAKKMNSHSLHIDRQKQEKTMASFFTAELQQRLAQANQEGRNFALVHIANMTPEGGSLSIVARSDEDAHIGYELLKPREETFVLRVADNQAFDPSMLEWRRNVDRHARDHQLAQLEQFANANMDVIAYLQQTEEPTP